MSILNYHPVSPRKSRRHGASLCLGEQPSFCKRLDLRYSFEAIVNAEYGGRDHLHVAAQNYMANVKKEDPGVSGITYEKALRNLVVTMYGHYVNQFRCHTATAGHRCLVAYNCLEVAAKLGHFHRAVRRLGPNQAMPDWLTEPEIPAGDPRKEELMDAQTQLGDPMVTCSNGPPVIILHRSKFTVIKQPSRVIVMIFIVKNTPHPCCARHATTLPLIVTHERQP